KGLVVRIKFPFAPPPVLLPAVVSPVTRQRPGALRNTHPKTAGQLYKPQRPNLPSRSRAYAGPLNRACTIPAPNRSGNEDHKLRGNSLGHTSIRESSRGVAVSARPLWNILVHKRQGADDCSITDFNAHLNDRTGADIDAVADERRPDLHSGFAKRG